MKTQFALVPLLLLSVLIEGTVYAADHSAIMPFVTNDVVAIAYVDLTTLDMSTLLAEAQQVGALAQDSSDQTTAIAIKLQSRVNELVSRGAAAAYILVRTSDLQDQGPSWVLTLKHDADSTGIVQRLTESFAGPATTAIVPQYFQAVDGAVLAARNTTQLERLTARRSGEPRADVMAALAALGQGNAGILVVGDADSRRVVREMFPRLPKPFDSIDGRMIAEDVLWGGVSVNLPPQPKVTVHIETSDVKNAETVRESTVKVLELAKQLLASELANAQSGLPSDAIRATLEELIPQTNDTAVTLTLGDDAEELAHLRALLAPPLGAARAAAQRSQRINQFKQLALAFWNYESANQNFVMQANYDAKGQPLLSWRVHLLPYLDQQALYAEFHLDEPWDSPHNRKLIERMPEVFADPNPAVRRSVGAGRTTFVAPVSAETVFPPREALPDGKPLRVRDVTDGTSKTILFVEVVPERAVVWTKPEDWNVDLEHALVGVQRADQSGFVAAFNDGSVRYMSHDVDEPSMRAFLTRSAGDMATAGN